MNTPFLLSEMGNRFSTILLLVAALFILSALPAQAATLKPGNSATQQVILAAPVQKVFAKASEAFKIWSRGKLLSVSESTLQVKGISRTKFFKFTDDITVSIQPDPADPNQSLVDLVSIGRMGEYDFGGNQRNLDEYLTTLKSLLKG